MTIRWIGAVAVAAAALTPFTAQAQWRGHGHDGRQQGQSENRDGGGFQGPQGVSEQAPRAEPQSQPQRQYRPQYQRPQGAPQVQVQPQQQQQVDTRGAYQGRGRFGGGYAGAGGVQVQQQGQVTGQRYEGQRYEGQRYQGQRTDGQQRYGGRIGERSYGGRYAPNAGQAYGTPGSVGQQSYGSRYGGTTTGSPTVRYGSDGRGYQDRGDAQRGYGQQRAYGTQGYGSQSYGNRGYVQDSRRYRDEDRGRGGHGSWNRSWRDDSRYDWRSYRENYSDRYRLGRYYSPYSNYGYRHYGIGAALLPLFYSERYWIDDPYSYRLPEAYGEYRWVRYYNDALLVDIYSGEIVDEIDNFFY